MWDAWIELFGLSKCFGDGPFRRVAGTCVQVSMHLVFGWMHDMRLLFSDSMQPNSINVSRVIGAVATRRSLVVEDDVVLGTVSKMRLSDVVNQINPWLNALSDGSVWYWSTSATVIASAPGKVILVPPVHMGMGLCRKSWEPSLASAVLQFGCWH
jgi:hypothetical protein